MKRFTVTAPDLDRQAPPVRVLVQDGVPVDAEAARLMREKNARPPADEFVRKWPQDRIRVDWPHRRVGARD